MPGHRIVLPHLPTYGCAVYIALSKARDSARVAHNYRVSELYWYICCEDASPAVINSLHLFQPEANSLIASPSLHTAGVYNSPTSLGRVLRYSVKSFSSP